MPRAHRRRPEPARPAFAGSAERREEWPDGSWVVRAVPASTSVKAYRCPGCDHEVAAGTAHVVAWPAEGTVTGADASPDRRHWHTPCWRARDRRRPRR